MKFVLPKGLMKRGKKLPSKQKVSISSEAQINIPPFFISLRKGEVIINFKFRSVIAFPSTSSGNGQNSFPVQLKFGNLLLDPPKTQKYFFF